ncbi:hypothetical protein IE077_001529 [Cardiosporidium cionae]|uniref:Uncharacterized protein n=1 Tax=Cardiosporidium cionae TaxID=476202 RepID=A0ABQ7J587_9APIC|nr:hypothetical protein IE077_001529 [Cardiosporidium cionae]|eukprot:KAF8819166.1 hypothetical protein IE077_001529 [Cardiosporidium cionae]
MDWDLFNDDIPVSPTFVDESPREGITTEFNEADGDNPSENPTARPRSGDIQNDQTDDFSATDTYVNEGVEEDPLFSTLPEDEIPQVDQVTTQRKRVIQPQLIPETFFRTTPDTKVVEKDALWDLYTLLNTKRNQNFPYCENEMNRLERMKKRHTEENSADFTDTQAEPHPHDGKTASSGSAQLLTRLKTEKSKDLKMNLNLLLKSISNFTQDIYPYNESLEKFLNRLDKISVKVPMFLDYRTHLLQKHKDDHPLPTSPKMDHPDEPAEHWSEFEDMEEMPFPNHQRISASHMEEDDTSMDWNDDWMGVDEPFDNENFDLGMVIPDYNEDFTDSATFEKMKATARNRLIAKQQKMNDPHVATNFSCCDSSAGTISQIPETSSIPQTSQIPVHERIEDEEEEFSLTAQELHQIEIAKAAALKRLRNKQNASVPAA